MAKSLDALKAALSSESEQLERVWRWLEQHMPPKFLQETPFEERLAIARGLLNFSEQNCFVQIHLRQSFFVLCMDGIDADLRVLKHFDLYAIRYYCAFVSDEHPPFCKAEGNLRIALVIVGDGEAEERLPPQRREEVIELAKKSREVAPEELELLLHDLTARFVHSMTDERLTIALDMFFRAQTRDLCQYEVRRNEDWKAKDAPSLQVVFAWKNVPKYRFLYHLAEMILQHGLALQKVSATYVNPHSSESILVLSMGLHGLKGNAAWEETDIEDFLRELCLLKYFNTDDLIHDAFVKPKLLTGNQAHIVRNMGSFVHQTLVYVDPNLYSFDHVLEGLCRHPELTSALCKAFEAKFNPQNQQPDFYAQIAQEFLQLVDKLDTGQAIYDIRRKNILHQALSFIAHTLKTNFYEPNKTGFSFRLDPRYLDQIPFERKEKFPEIPYAIFFIRGMHFIGFNIRFKDLARGGVRTVIPERWEGDYHERNNIFSEAYNLAYTQQKKNKDIPEGGAKTAILLAPYDVFSKEEEIYRQEMEADGGNEALIEEKLKIYQRDHKLAYLQASQRAFVQCFMTLINCDDDGTLRAKSIVDYWKKPEYIYLGPDENMFNDMIVWIANFAVEHNYKPGRSFMSSKPGAGINHKEFGVTSYGVNVYLQQVLLYLGIDPQKTPFTIKVSGGPDGDVAGNELLNLYTHYPKTAKLLALTDVSGTIYDPNGLDLKELIGLFHKSLPIRNYPHEKLSENGFLLDIRTKREESAYAQQTLCWRHNKQEWLSGNEMNQLYRNNLHQIKTDAFVPGGGRPRTLNESNYTSFLDETGKPTSKAIVEGANLYLTPAARHALEKLGVLIIKDSSCNKGGVICSSFEVLASLCMSEEQFLKEKKEYVKEVLEIIGKAALNEANLLLNTHKETGQFLTEISDAISQKINLFKYQLLDYLTPLPLLPNDPLIKCLLNYCPPLLRTRYTPQILAMPDIHKKAIISCYLASHLVYKRGLSWNPTIADVLPMVAKDFDKI